jgi:hypothetical protein
MQDHRQAVVYNHSAQDYLRLLNQLVRSDGLSEHFDAIGNHSTLDIDTVYLHE